MKRTTKRRTKRFHKDHLQGRLLVRVMNSTASAWAILMIHQLTGCSPIAPSLSKDLIFPPPGSGGQPTQGANFNTYLYSETDPVPDEALSLGEEAIIAFKQAGQVAISMSPPPGKSVNGLFKIALPSSTLPSLQGFQAELIPTGVPDQWLLRVRNSTHVDIIHLVQDHLGGIFLSFGETSQSTTDEITTDDEFEEETEDPLKDDEDDLL